MPDPTFAELIRVSRGNADAHAYLSFAADRILARRIGEVGLELLRHVGPMPGACAPMSALYAGMLQARMPDCVVHMVAGRLLAGDLPIFGAADQAANWAQTFSTSTTDWDGHCWLVCDDYIIDVSVFRTAYSSKAPPALARAVRAGFGEGRGLLIAQDTWPLRYFAEHVLIDEQIAAFAGGARQLFAGPQLSTAP